ncbi:hypothetical protein IC582_019766 [Cucumis melo]
MELIAMVFAVQRWRLYLLGRKFIVKTDQRSLKFLFEQRVIQPQHQKWIAKLLGYSFDMVYKPGLENKAADALSRAPPTAHLNHISAPALLDLVIIQQEVDNDNHLKSIKTRILDQQEEIPDFTMHQGILKYKDRLVLSKSSTLIPTVSHTYHGSVFGGHSRFFRTYKRLTGELYWEGMKGDIKKYCEECLICQGNKALALSPAGLLIPLEIPDKI